MDKEEKNQNQHLKQNEIKANLQTHKYILRKLEAKRTKNGKEETPPLKLYATCCIQKQYALPVKTSLVLRAWGRIKERVGKMQQVWRRGYEEFGKEKGTAQLSPFPIDLHQRKSNGCYLKFLKWIALCTLFVYKRKF